jgi:hypothetical protein
VKSNYKPADGIANSTSSESASEKYIYECVTGSTFESNYYMINNIAKVGGSNISTSNQNGSPVAVKYFWLNGIKYVLVDGNSNFVGADAKGYYKLNNDYLKYSEGSNSYFYRKSI